MIKIKRGLDLPIGGKPEQEIDDGRPARSVALIGYDYPGLKPTMEVAAGDRVVKGQLVFTDKKNPGVRYTAPASGTVAAINRGDKRVFESLVIDVEGDEQVEFKSRAIDALSRQDVVDQLVESGEWTAIRTRPYNKVPAIAAVPADIFVTAIDTRPLSADPGCFIREQSEAFSTGVDVLAKLTEGQVYVCAGLGANVPRGTATNVQLETFSGPHPAGLVGTHIHFLSAVNAKKSVWHVGYQDVIAIGQLFSTGKLFSERVVAIGGPGVERPRLIRTRLGASIDELMAGEFTGEMAEDEQRVISGSVFDGRTSRGSLAYLGRYHNQVSVLEEGRKREFMGFIAPGTGKFSLTRLFVTSLFGNRYVKITTSTGGSTRSMVPLGTYEEVMPLDVLATQLLRALLVSDIDTAIQLGCLELDEEDLALCTFACPGKYEYGPYLREMLTRIEAEG